MPEQQSITPDQLIKRLDAAIAIHACKQGSIETVSTLDPRRIGIEAVQEARRAIRVHEATHPIGQATMSRAMSGL